MKKRVFDFNNVPKDKSWEASLGNTWAIIMDMLSEEDENKIKADFKAYMEDCKSRGEEYLPAYLWTLQRIKVGLK